MLMKVSVPVEAGNKSIKEGLLPKTVTEFVDKMKPEAVYWYAEGGKRTGMFVLDVKDPTMLPSMCEPFFMNLNASIDLTPVMNLDELKHGVERAMKKG
jgi:hypothetical protein